MAKLIRTRVLRRDQVEDEASEVLDAFAKRLGKPIAPPVDVDMIGEALFDLRWEWDVIEDPGPSSHPGVILAGLYPRDRRVVLNEHCVDIFRSRPGLERFTKGHETGHWVLHVDNSALDQPGLFDTLGSESDGPDYFICRDGDTSWPERQADWFSAALLMPRTLMLSLAQPLDLTQWRPRYELAERFGVTISALSTRLAHLGLGYVREDGTLCRTRQERDGQVSLL